MDSKGFLRRPFTLHDSIFGGRFFSCSSARSLRPPFGRMGFGFAQANRIELARDHGLSVDWRIGLSLIRPCASGRTFALYFDRGE